MFTDMGWGTEDLTLANDIFIVPQFQKTPTRLFPAHVLRTMGILMHAAALPCKAHEAARTLNRKLQPAQQRRGLKKEILNQQKISTTLLITQQHTGDSVARSRREQQGRVSRLISTQNRLYSFGVGRGANLAI